MDNESERVPPQDNRRKTSSGWRFFWQFVLVLLAAALCYVSGLFSGAEYGGNYAPGFSFLGLPGYEGSGQMAGLVSGATILVVLGAFRGLLRRPGTAVWILCGGLIGIVFGAPLFFPVIAPSVGWLAVVYFACVIVGSIVGIGVAALTSRRTRSKR